MPPIYRALSQSVSYWCTRWCSLCRTLGNTPTLVCPALLSCTSLTSVLVGCQTQPESCCQHTEMLPRDVKSICLVKRASYLPQAWLFAEAPVLAFLQKKSHSPCATHFCSCLNPPGQKLWCPHSASCSLQMVSSSPLHALRSKPVFQWHYHFPGRPGKAIRIGWKEVIQTIREPRPCLYSNEQNDKLPSQAGSGFTESINFCVFFRASKKSPSFPTQMADDSALAGTKGILLLK